MYANFIYTFLINATCDCRVWYGRREYGVSYTRKHSAMTSCVYKAIWTPVVGQVLHVQSEDSNKYDRFAVATHLRDDLPLPLFSLLLFQNILDSAIGFYCRSFSYICL